MGKNNFASLEDVLGLDNDKLAELKMDEIETEKLGTLPITALENPEYKQAKKDCIKMVKDGTGGMTPELDDDLLMLRIIVAAVAKDKRSNFTFASKQLLEKLGVVQATAAVEKLLSPGEIYEAAMAIQNISGFGEKAQKQREDEIKNS